MNFGLCSCEHGHPFVLFIIQIIGRVRSNSSWSLFVRTQLLFHVIVNVTRLKNTNMRVEYINIQINIRVHKNMGIVHFKALKKLNGC